MQDLEKSIEEIVKKIRFRDAVASIAIATVFLIFGFLILMLLDIIFIPFPLKTYVAISLLIIAWILMSVGIYLLSTMPMPKFTTKIVADSFGVEKLIEKGYKGRIFITNETFKKIPKEISAKVNLQVIEVDSKEAEKYKKHGEELSYAIVAAKKIGSSVVSSKRGEIDGVKIITVEDLK